MALGDFPPFIASIGLEKVVFGGFICFDADHRLDLEIWSQMVITRVRGDSSESVSEKCMLKILLSIMN